MRFVPGILALCLLLGCLAAPARAGCNYCLQGKASADQAADEPLDTAAIDQTARRLMAREDVKGLALAVIEDGELRYYAAYGQRNVEQHLPLTADTIMYGASLTKTAFACMVLQLVDEGRLSLDTPLGELLPAGLPDEDYYSGLAADPRWRGLTPRILLSHGSGLPNLHWLEPDQALRLHFEPGSRYAYSGEGFWLLQAALEQGLSLDVGAEMQRRIFDPLGMRSTSMTWRPDFARNLADGYGIDGTFEPHDERSSVSAAGSMDTTIADQGRLWAAILRGDGLSTRSRRELFAAQQPITSAQQFPTFSAPPGGYSDSIALAAGLGLVTYQDRSGPAFFKGGHNDFTGNLVLGFMHERRGLVLLSNSVRAELIYPELAEAILGPSDMPWAWEYSWLND